MPPVRYPTLTFLRPFSSTSCACKNEGILTTRSHLPIPPYPYGPALHYKQSNSGLYGGSSIQFGNKVSSKNEIKTRRSWKPNIHQKRLWSDALQKFVSVKVQARVLRTIDKVGGLDEYLLGNKPARVKELGVEGWRLRWRVLRTERVGSRLKEERKRLGLPAEGLLGDQAPVFERKARRGEKRVKEEVEKEIERVSGDIVEKIEAAGSKLQDLQEQAKERELAETTGDQVQDLQAEVSEAAGPSTETLQERVERTARKIEEEAALRAPKPAPGSTEEETIEPPRGRKTKAERRAWKAAHGLGASTTTTPKEVSGVDGRLAKMAEEAKIRASGALTPEEETKKRDAETERPREEKKAEGGIFRRVRAILRKP
ncbi:39S ribosomal protein L24, mitochondrial [Mycoblastus sanguinarius]|nr:39S ribosomal protein L24, mitochondrial [Mycoblastus sanguinarius]